MPELLALLDLGSNAARFVLARINPGVGYRVLQKERIQTRLGDGRAGELPPDAVALTLSSVSGFLERLGINGAPLRLMAVATAAVRDAPNRDCLLQVLKQRDGADVRLLSDREEAHLGALVAMRHLPIREGVIGDLGGGSLQLTQVRAGRITSASGVPVGAVRMTRRFLRGDPPTPREIRALRDLVRDHLLGVLPAARRGDELLGLGGTVRTLARCTSRLRPVPDASAMRCVSRSRTSRLCASASKRSPCASGGASRASRRSAPISSWPARSPWKR
jgi:exopolyphosphatase/guanosine-5'-triphosphate,3'-diphosphate pyrophosphatase